MTHAGKTPEQLAEELTRLGRELDELQRQRAEVEEARRESEQRFHNIFTDGPHGIVIVDLARKFRSVNQAFCDMLGYSAGELLTRSFIDVTHPAFIERDLELTRRLFAGDIPYFKADKQYVRKDGGVRDGSVTATVIRDQAGMPLYFLSMIEDITERKQSEQEIERQRDLARQYLDIAGVLMVALDIDGRVTLLNQKGCNLLGYSPAEMLGQDWVDLCVPPANRRQVRELFRELMAGRVASTEYFENEVVAKEGAHYLISFHNTLIRDPSGRVLGTLSSGEDITERRRSEAALRESERRLADIIQFLPDATMVIDHSGRIVAWNQAMEEITGVKAEGMLGQGDHQHAMALAGERRPLLVDLALHPELERGWTYSRLEREGELLWRTEYRIELQGHPAYLASTATALRDSNGLVVGAIESIRNVTGQKTAELERSSLEDQLRQSQKMEAIGRLAGGVAHDFNNLLTSIIGNVSLALMDLDPMDPVHLLLGEVKQAADSATGLTRQLLAFSRKQMIEPRIVDLNELVRNLRNMLSRLIGEDIELTTLLALDLGYVKVDPGQFEQVLFNLAVNARDAMPDGGRLTIETANVTLVPQGDQVCVTIGDTGCGMTEEVKIHCFEPFFTTKPNESGTGLGLASVYAVLQQAGGLIDFLSQPGQGATFKLYLPRMHERAEPSVGPRSIPAMPVGTETILLVEDEPMVHQLAVRILRRLGYQVLHCLNATEALLAAERHAGEIQLLMTDIVMPGMNGRVLAERFRTLRPSTKVLFTSGYAEDAIARHGVREQGIPFLAKPYTVQSLARKIREVLEQT